MRRALSPEGGVRGKPPYRGLAHEEGLTIAFTTHHPHNAHAAADTTLFMPGGREFLCAPTKDVMTEEHPQDLHNVGLKRFQFAHKGRTIETFGLYTGSWTPSTEKKHENC